MNKIIQSIHKYLDDNYPELEGSKVLNKVAGYSQHLHDDEPSYMETTIAQISWEIIRNLKLLDKENGAE